MLNQGDNFYQISLNILITCLLDNVRILRREVSCGSLLGVKRLSHFHFKLKEKQSPPAKKSS